MAGHYLAGTEATQPLVSPLHADLLALPPLLIQVGSAEILPGDAAKLAERAGGPAPL
jgi:epsilon-lactone hydrolase